MWLHRRDAGSIPAHAGEPQFSTVSWTPPWVHPRTRGGATAEAERLITEAGPSPHTRGSRRAADHPRAPVGSIPAHAGEPPKRRLSRSSDRVHPRTRGGAAFVRSRFHRTTGPSPHTRGSRGDEEDRPGSRGSIPAHAGEPRPSRRDAPSAWVHPRTRGGAATSWSVVSAGTGPSPHTRGSRDCEYGAVEASGSIPAHAGEPVRQRSRGPVPGVHPRTRGGAMTGLILRGRPLGPSPHTRGSLALCHTYAPPDGSIPAHAGEPGSGWPSPSPARVHPRTRGGASIAPAMIAREPGPSPHTRGSHQRDLDGFRRLGSIPAHAGEPR